MKYMNSSDVFFMVLLSQVTAALTGYDLLLERRPDGPFKRRWVVRVPPRPPPLQLTHTVRVNTHGVLSPLSTASLCAVLCALDSRLCDRGRSVYTHCLLRGGATLER